MHSVVSLLAVRVIPMSNQHPTAHSVTVRPSETVDMAGHDWTWHNDKYYLKVATFLVLVELTWPETTQYTSQSDFLQMFD